jgi:hypothetical protein
MDIVFERYRKVSIACKKISNIKVKISTPDDNAIFSDTNIDEVTSLIYVVMNRNR